MQLTIVAGARPNFMKIAPIIHALARMEQGDSQIKYRLVHTGQHYDKNMSGRFFEDLGIPEPDVNLDCKGSTQAEQTGSILVNFERELLVNPANLVVVVGDVTSTMACAITAKKLCTRVAHVEAGIRSGDLSMPEEINRIVTDSISDYFFTTSDIAGQNLRAAGIPDDRIFFVGNTMIDSLLANRSRFVKPVIFDQLDLMTGNYIVLTLHRPSNVDETETLQAVLDAIVASSRNIPIVFPVHPRTAKALKTASLYAPNLHMIEPLGYLEFNYLVNNSKCVITDSGGITEETTVLGIPCITLRDSTEGPETVTHGTNELIGTKPQNIGPTLNKLFSGSWKKGSIPELWDGRAAERIVQVLAGLQI